MTMQDWTVERRWNLPPVLRAKAVFKPVNPPRVAGAADAIIREVAQDWRIPVKVLLSESRRRYISWARFEAVYRIRTECPWMSYPNIARKLGFDCHTSCIHAFRRFEKLTGSDEFQIVRAGGKLGRKAPREALSGGGGRQSLDLGAAPNNEA
jgi:hypothetical protein